MGRTARGVTGIRMAADDEVVGMEVLSDNNFILAVSERGLGKRTEIAEYRLQSRGGKGIINLKTTPKVGFVTRIKQVTGDEDIMLISNTGNIIRLGVNEVSLLHRSTQGVKLIDLADGEKLVGLARVEREEPDTGEELPDAETETFDF
ncbi:DNA gyrase subunit A [subsurface metagenome]